MQTQLRHYPSLVSSVLEQNRREREILRQRYPSWDKLASAVLEQEAKKLRIKRQHNPQLAEAEDRFFNALRNKTFNEEQSVLKLKRTRTVFETQELTVFRRKTY